MAVTTEQIKARLKAKYPKANLSQKRIDAMAAKLAPKPKDGATDEEIDLVLEGANDIFSFEEIAKEDDRIRTLETNQKTGNQKTQEEIDAEAKAKADAEAVEKAKTGSETPEYIKTLMSTIEGLKADIVEVKTGKVLETKKASAADIFGKSEILKALKDDVKPNWLNRIDVNSETPIEDQVTALETEYTTMAQSFADSIGYSGPTPTYGKEVPKADPTMIAGIVDNMKL